jgi:hypothetical protein
MAYIQVWVKPEKVQEVKSSLQQFVRYQNDSYEVEAEKLGGNVVLVVYKRVPGRLFMEKVTTLETLSIARMRKTKTKKP